MEICQRQNWNKLTNTSSYRVKSSRSMTTFGCMFLSILGSSFC